jgi:hypothetical protein
VSYRINEAYNYYAEHILAPLRAKVDTYKKYGFETSMTGLVPFRDWEVFVAILVNDRGTGKAYGSDLQRHEVKSVHGTGGLEYQYHRKSAKEKFKHDRSLTHVLIAYDNNYEDLGVYVLPREQFVKITEQHGWWDRIWEAYYDPDRERPAQRCRPSIPFAEVKNKGENVMTVKCGKLEPD